MLVLLFFGIAVFSPSCKRDDIDNDPSAKVSFDADTVFFDTVFTTLGGGPFPRSVNKRLKVYNPHSNTIKTSIRLAGGTASPYRINIDGESLTQINDYEIMGGDSIYIFVEVSIDPNNTNNPLIVKDSIEFITNGNFQDVKLVAWGQDAHYFRDSVLSCNTVWNDQTKPYVIYQSVLVPENCKLTIGEGVKIYSDVNSTIYVQGTIEINGTANNRVKLQGARLGVDFEDIPGQWRGIHLLTTSNNNIIRYADIENGEIGVRLDSLPNNFGPKAQIENTLIQNMSAVGVLAFTSRLRMLNCCVNNCGQYTFAGDLGGDYDMRHCTFANYGGTFSRREPSFALSNADLVDENGKVLAVNNLQFNIRNSIIYGSLREELAIYNDGQGVVLPTIENNIIRSELQGYSATNQISIDPRFKDIEEQDFSLDTLSPAKDKGPLLSPLVSKDLEGTNRDSKPDIGAYERVE